MKWKQKVVEHWRLSLQLAARARENRSESVCRRAR
ncbi:Uncharacterised protein [Vibrio cholerae]|nr:Uncharacterised protein [Vibrio cholerae]